VFANPRTVSRLISGLSGAANDPPYSDTQSLTGRLSAGEEEAFREFHARYFDPLYRFLLGVCRGDAHAAQDALQSTLLRVARNARAFEREDIFWGWLKAVARNAARDQSRRRHRYWGLLEKFTFARDSNHEPEGEIWREALGESLSEMPPNERELLEGKYILGSSVAELAAQAGLTEKAVESRLFRLRRELAARVLQKLREQ
jgi:RNA polymerase sigma-70 factor (ECF subfamily)